MAESHEIKKYKYYTFSSRDASTANTVILFYGDTEYLGGAFFSNDDEAPLEPAVKHPSGVFGLRYRYADLPVIVDMLRNEKPVYLIYSGEQNTRISTTSEPVGEGENM
jgi:hypothetical protein